MKRFNTQVFKSSALLAATLTLGGPVVRAQTNSLLQLTSILVDRSGSVRFSFSDAGTNLTNYSVEFRTDLEAGTAWQTVTNAVIATSGGGGFSVQIDSTQEQRGFYRVVGLGDPSGPIVIEFSTVALQVTEGGTALPVLRLSQPFQGTVYYTVSGTAMSGDYMELSGQVAVNGTSAKIPVSLTDNDLIGQLKYLTLRLEAGSGYELGANAATTIAIEENDAEWHGSFVTEEASLGFVLKIQESNGAHVASLGSDGAGFFPATEVPVSLNFTANNFAAAMMNVPIPAGTTLLNEPMQLTLVLDSKNGIAGQSVTPTFIEGTGSLIVEVPARPHLNTANAGRFSLIRPPVAPSTNQVELMNVP